MNEPIALTRQHVDSRAAELGFSVEWPQGWHRHPLPDEAMDFTSPQAFLPLAIVTAPHAAIVLAFAARPAHDDGALLDWTRWHLQQQALEPRTLAARTVAGVAAVVGEAEQASDLGPMVVRFAFLEDGGRLVEFSLSAPEMLADAVHAVWMAALGSFTLDTPRGATASLRATPAGESVPDAGPPTQRPRDDDAAPTPSRQPPAHVSQTEDVVDDDEAAAEDAACAVVADDGSTPLGLDEPTAQWWRRARALEQAGRLDEAEAAIREAVPHLSFAAEIAELHRRRMRRLKASGDVVGAREAFERARAFIGFYATQATSGGEGTALSAERDAFLVQLDAEFDR